MVENFQLKLGDVVQLNPDTIGNRAFAGCFLVVTELKAFGCQGYVQALGNSRDTQGGQAYLRPRWVDMEFVGHAQWVIDNESLGESA